ncbi:hypothetical protein HQQ82_05255 [Rathayibacter sp. VKM Ac-2856]|uniref:hypothetical protein n=1 Tax=unclassified Rathayibacter TaxID=2609250 RepID=UPI001563FD35|nr:MULTISPECIES: hypothetical protein [unclassified Rathayibacter]NQX04205.1 hypothetical protein [Rathayibacter sp. VKM Ac-2858]NQX19374.1 hypothetical protein [Rathayibacter sp. VKM Ac-2856]
MTEPAAAGPLLRAVVAELRRVVASRTPLWGLVFGLLPVLPLLLAVAPVDLRALPPGESESLEHAITAALLQGGAVGAAAFGALRTAAAFEKGILARDVLSSGLRSALGARLLTAATVGAVLATASVAIGLGGVAVVSAGEVAPDPGAAALIPVVGVAGAIWGALIGTIVRAPLFVLFAALAPLSAATLTSGTALEDVAPLAALSASTPPTATAVLAGPVWLLVLAVVAVATGRRRPLL